MRQMMKISNSQNGFTLAELVISIAVLAIISAVVISSVNPVEQTRKAHDGQRKADLAQIQRALETYYQDFGRYPDNPSALDYRIKRLDNTPVAWGDQWRPYMNVVPKDPSSAWSYVYFVPDNANGQTYYLYASLERGARDPQVCNSGSACRTLPQGATCGGVCNYAVSSSNVSP